MIPFKINCTILILALCSVNLSGQLNQGGRPIGLPPTKSAWQEIRLPAIGVADQLRSDEETYGAGKKKGVFAREFSYSLTPENSGDWITTDDGTRIWILHVRGDGARSLGLIFDSYRLESGARLFLFDPGQKQILGAFSSENNKAGGVFPVSHINGEELRVQLELPPGLDRYGELKIGSIIRAFQPLLPGNNAENLSYGDADWCNVDIMCAEGNMWQQHKRSVCKIIIGAEVCSGVLVNNTAGDKRPLVYTAAHCISKKGDADKAIFYFNYESSQCNGPDGIKNHSISGCTLLATGDTLEIDRDSLDFSLVELSVPPPASFLPYFAGWNLSASPPDNTVIIHHPRGDVMKISVDRDPPDMKYHDINFFPDLLRYSHWRILRWDAGTTQGGSSGGPLFNQEKLVVGTLTGGYARCDSNVYDYFTRTNIAWNYYPQHTRQLKHWLDPLDTGVSKLEGLDPITGIQTPVKRSGMFRVYPNPGTGVFEIELNELVHEKLTISVVDLRGAEVYRESVSEIKSWQLDLSRLTEGIYFLKLNSPSHSDTQKILLTR